MIGDDKVRVLITITKDMKIQLEELAEKENRTVSNLVVTVLKEHIKSKLASSEPLEPW